MLLFQLLNISLQIYCKLSDTPPEQSYKQFYSTNIPKEKDNRENCFFLQAERLFPR